MWVLLFSAGFATCAALRPYVGLHVHPAVWYAMPVTSVPTRAFTALVRRLAHLCSILAWFSTGCAQPECGGREMARTPWLRWRTRERGLTGPARAHPAASTTVSKRARHTHLPVSSPHTGTPQSDEMNKLEDELMQFAKSNKEPDTFVENETTEEEDSTDVDEDHDRNAINTKKKTLKNENKQACWLNLRISLDFTGGWGCVCCEVAYTCRCSIETACCGHVCFDCCAWWSFLVVDIVDA